MIRTDVWIVKGECRSVFQRRLASPYTSAITTNSPKPMSAIRNQSEMMNRKPSNARESNLAINLKSARIAGVDVPVSFIVATLNLQRRCEDGAICAVLQLP